VVETEVGEEKCRKLSRRYRPAGLSRALVCRETSERVAVFNDSSAESPELGHYAAKLIGLRCLVISSNSMNRSTNVGHKLTLSAG